MPYAPQLFTDEHPPAVVQAAQYLGTKVIKDVFFPRWMVNQFAQAELINVERPMDVKTGRPSSYATVRVWSKDKSTSESVVVYAPLPKPRKKPSCTQD